MIISLVALLLTLVFGGGEDPFVLPNAQKVAKKTIKDKERKKEVLGLMKSYVKEWKNLQKLTKKQTKAATKLNSDYSFDSNEFLLVFEKNREGRKSRHEIILDYRLSIQNKITDEEWTLILKEVAGTKKKVTKKKNKAQLKAQLKQDKRILMVENEIKAAFEDPAKIENVIVLLDQFHSDMADLMFNIQEESAIVADAMKSRTASKDDLQSVVDEYEELRAGAQKSFVSLRSELIKISTEAQWKKISKAMNKLF